MDWLIRKTDPEPSIIFNVGSSNPCPAGRFGVGIIHSTDFKSLTVETSMAWPALVDVGSIF